MKDGAPSPLLTFKVMGAPIYTRILKLIICYLKKRDQVHNELPVSFTEKTNIFEKKRSTIYL